MNLTAAIEAYLTDMQRRHATGATTAESSYYGPLENLLNTVGASLKPKVLCVGQLGRQDQLEVGLRPRGTNPGQGWIIATMEPKDDPANGAT